jgi:hypothetical protein
MRSLGVVVLVGCSGSQAMPPDADLIDARVFSANVVFMAHTQSGISGVEDADALCAAQATRYKLPGPFVAWLSTSTMDARDRLAGSRGWVRSDGRPFIASIEDMAIGRIWYPPDRGPEGERWTSLGVTTGTDPDGTASTETCEDWTYDGDAREHVPGQNKGTTIRWTSAYRTSCTDRSAVYCFGIGRDVEVAPTPVDGRLVFVSTPWAPGGGLADADAHCNADAGAAGRPGVFRAYLDQSSMPASSRFLDGRPWVRVDGVPIADTAIDAIAGAFETTRNTTLDGRYVTDPVWRGGGGRPCEDWTSSLPGIGAQTIPVELVDEPLVGAETSCATAHPLLCYEE